MKQVHCRIALNVPAETHYSGLRCATSLSNSSSISDILITVANSLAHAYRGNAFLRKMKLPEEPPS